MICMQGGGKTVEKAQTVLLWILRILLGICLGICGIIAVIYLLRGLLFLAFIGLVVLL